MACLNKSNKDNFLQFFKVSGDLTLADLQATGSPLACDNVTPTAPFNLSLSNVTLDSIKLTFQSESSGPYNIQRSLDNFSWSQVASTSSLVYTDSNLDNETLYYYRVEDSNNVGEYSNVESAQTLELNPINNFGPNLVMWLDETFVTIGSEIDEWTDESGNNNDVFDISDKPETATESVNGESRTVADFANRNSGLMTSSSLGLTSTSVYVLFKANATNGGLRWYLQDITSSGGYTSSGFGILIRNNAIEAQYRDGSTTKIYTRAFTDTSDYHVVQFKIGSNGTGSSIVKFFLDGDLMTLESGLNSMNTSSNEMQVGQNQSVNTESADGFIAEVIISDTYSSQSQDDNMYKYFNEKYGFSFSDRYTNYDVTALNEKDIRYNGLDVVDVDGDGIKEIFSGEGESAGNVYISEWNSSSEQWDTTQIFSVGAEISDIKMVDIDSDGIYEIFITQKVTGQLTIYKPDTSNYKGAYSSATLSTGNGGIQDILLYDVDGDGDDEVLFTFTGTSSGNGGISWLDWDGGDVLDSGNWSEYVAIQHEAAWWMAGFDSNGDLIFTARNSQNSSPDPGLYKLTPAATITNVWSETTIDNTVSDWVHCELGDFFGNATNDDILAANDFNSSTVSIFDSGSAYAKTSITGTFSVNNTHFIANLGKTSRSASRDTFLHWVKQDGCYVRWWNGSSWDQALLYSIPSGHTADNDAIRTTLGNGSKEMVVIGKNQTTEENAVLGYSIDLIESAP